MQAGLSINQQEQQQQQQQQQQRLSAWNLQDSSNIQWPGDLPIVWLGSMWVAYLDDVPEQSRSAEEGFYFFSGSFFFRKTRMTQVIFHDFVFLHCYFSPFFFKRCMCKDEP